MKSIPKLLSKTKIMRGYRCLKCIYLTIHSPKLEAAITPELQALFDQGHIVGEAAQKKISGGVLVDNAPWDFIGSLHKTRELIANNTEIIYEAAFEYKGCYARVDILQYSKTTQRWKIFEVKSSTKVKEEQIDDVGLQAWIVANSGVPLEQINILHLNKECIFPNLENLFVTYDVTQKLREIYPSITPKMNEIFTSIRSESCPNIDIGQHCVTPNDCGFKDYCWSEKQIPKISVLDIPKLGPKKWEFYRNGILKLDDPKLSQQEDLLPVQQRVIEVFKTGKRFINPDGIKTAIKDWKFPLVFLDFETINPAIPRYDKTSPFSQVPFQYSVHVLNSLNSELIHHEFLHDSKSDPRPTLIPALIKACSGTGSIVAYFSQFESDRIQEMAILFPEYSQALNELLTRMVDPLPIFREHVYDNEFAGSFSLKKVAPAILGKHQSYEGMTVADGNAAQRAFEQTIDDSVAQNQKNIIKKAMLEYCKKDTLVMVELVQWLYQFQNHCQ